MTVAIDQIDPPDLPESGTSFTHGTVVTGAQRLVFVSGQPPWDRVAPVPGDFEAQRRLAWRNVERVLAGAGLGLGNLAKVTVYLSDRQVSGGEQPGPGRGTRRAPSGAHHHHHGHLQ